MKKITVLAPEYFKNFQCTGSICEDTCCKHWNITVDKNTYKKYKKLKKNTFHPLQNKQIILNKNKTGPYDYALIKLDEQNQCPFLDEHQLCTIYKHLDEAYMPLTCKMYPRNINYINEDIEISLTLSCPEAARQALLAPTPMTFEHIEIEYREYMDLSNNLLLTEGSFLLKEEYREFWNIRIAAISILQNKRFDIVSRLMLLGLLYNRIQTCIDHQTYEHIQQEISKFVNETIPIMNVDVFSTLEKNITRQITFTQRLLDEDGIGRRFREKFLRYLNAASAVLEYTQEEPSDENDHTNYRHLLQKSVIPFLESETCTNIIENYLVNEYFRELMPFGKYEMIKDSLIMLCFSYSMIKTFLVGQVFMGNSLTTDILVEIIYLVSRDLTHNSSYREFVLQNLKNAEMSTLGGLYTIIFNK